LVNTFLPVADFRQSCEFIDTVRLGKQRSEIKIILTALTGVRFKKADGIRAEPVENYGYSNHAVARMWRGHERALARLGIETCDVWADRYGHSIVHGTGSDTFKDMVAWHNWCWDNGADDDEPSWFGDPKVHSMYRAKLLFKDPEWYGKFGWSEEPDDNFIYPA